MTRMITATDRLPVQQAKLAKITPIGNRTFLSRKLSGIVLLAVLLLVVVVLGEANWLLFHFLFNYKLVYHKCLREQPSHKTVVHTNVL